ncbi:hypothetical protein [Neobacillus sp. FSL H8-0543]|uniref:hypothetical protein n=1 Tax=Neobacillus sp. FSL H8-0543 TaxID=2954672 RepID=UPI003159881D
MADALTKITFHRPKDFFRLRDGASFRIVEVEESALTFYKRRFLKDKDADDLLARKKLTRNLILSCKEPGPVNGVDYCRYGFMSMISFGNDFIYKIYEDYSPISFEKNAALFDEINGLLGLNMVQQ